MLSILALSLALISSLGTGSSAIVSADVDSSFATSTNVQLNVTGLQAWWVSAAEEDGRLLYATSSALLASSPFIATSSPARSLVFASRANKRTHHVQGTQIPLGLGSTVFYKIVSGGTTSTEYSTPLPDNPLNALGPLLKGSISYEGGAPGNECLVSARVKKTGFVDTYSLWVNTITPAATGTFAIDITNIRQDPTNNPFSGENNFDNQFTFDTGQALHFLEVIARCDAQRFVMFSDTMNNIDKEDIDLVNIHLTVAEPPPLPTFGFVSSTAQVTEGDGGTTNLQLEVTLEPLATSSASVTISVTGGTASAGTDFGAIASPLTFAASTTVATATIPITGDLLDELDETIVLTLSIPSSGTQLGATTTATVTIVDDDDPPTLAAGATASGAENSGTIDVALTLSGASGLPISLRYTTTDATATTANGDYTGVAGVIHTIAAGDTASTISLAVTGDATYEADETFTVAIGNATTTNGAVITTAGATTVTIENDEVPTTTADPNYAGTEGTLLTIVVGAGVLVNDDGEGLSVTRTTNLVTDVATGTLTLAADGSFTYLPSGDFPHTSTSATTTFVYNFFDGRFTSANATATITVSNVNDAPVGVEDFYAVVPGQVLNKSAATGVLNNDIDVDGDNLTAILVGALTSTPSDLTAGALTFNADGSFDYDPQAFIGTATFEYRAQDPSLEFSDTTTVTLSQGPTFIMTLPDPSTVDEDSSSKDVLITLINPDSANPSIVTFSTADDTATAGSDYTAITNQTVSLGPVGGSLTATITVAVLNDASDPIREGEEQFDVKLSESASDSGGTAWRA